MNERRSEYRGAALLALADSYALDAISDDERSAISAGLAAADAVTRIEFNIVVRDIQETMALASAADEMAPPIGLRSRLLDELASTAQDASPSTPAVSSLDSHRAAKKSRRSGLLAAAAAVVVAVGGVVVGVQVVSDHGSSTAATTAAQQVLAAADVHTAKTAFPGGGSASVSFSPSRDSAVVTLDGVPAPAAGKAYQMWVVAGAPRSVGVLTDQGLMPTNPTVVTGVGKATDFAFSLEPAGGSVTPTEVLVALPLSA